MRCRLALLVVAAGVTTTAAADLSVLSAGAIESAVRTLAGQYQREFRRDVSAVFATGPEIGRQLAAGAGADVLIAPAAVMNAAAKAGRVLADTQVEVARVGVGVAVRRGAAAPDVSTVGGLKDALASAAVVVFNEASTGQHVETLLERLALHERLKPKVKRYATAAEVLSHLARGGDRALGFGPITQIRDFEAKGVTFVGPLPKEVQTYTAYVAAVTSEARAPDSGREFVRYLTSAAARRTFAASGCAVGSN